MQYSPKFNVFASSQIGVTIQNALKHPFYKHHWAQVTAEEFNTPGLEILNYLPPVSRHDLELMEPFVREGDQIIAISHSSGTTGKLVYRYRTREEVEAITTLFEDLDVDAHRLSLRICLRLLNPGHGSPIYLKGGKLIVLNGAVFHNRFIKQTIEVLQKQFYAPTLAGRVEAIVGPISDVRLLTHFLIDAGFENGRFPMKYLGIYGGYLSRNQRSLLANFWKVEPCLSFSLAEMFGGGQVCPYTDDIDFDPHLWPRCLDFETLEEVESGPGLLALTELYPFGQCQPLINYLTGDIVERVSNGLQNPSIRYLGRDISSIRLKLEGKETLLMGGADLYEALDIPGVKKNIKYSQIQGLIDPSVVGEPLGGGKLLESVQSPQIQVHFSPTSNEKDVIASMIKNTLLQRSSVLKECVENKLVDLTIIPDPAWQIPIVMK